MSGRAPAGGGTGAGAAAAGAGAAGTWRGTSRRLRVLVVTVVHRPDDARILHRQVAALVAAGHQVSYAGPFAATGVARPAHVRTADLPRAAGRRRGAALRAAAALLSAEGPAHDVVLLHDPELLLAAAAAGLLGPGGGRAPGGGPSAGGGPGPGGAGRRRPVVVWDVHEDTAAAVTLKPWLPVPLRRPTAAAVALVERAAERRVRLLLAEDGYRGRFSRAWPVVPNSTLVPAAVPPPGDSRAVYVGHLSVARGALDLVAVGRALAGSGVALHVVGDADARARGALADAHAAGQLTWHGYLPNDDALALVEGSLAGLSLLHDEPNYRHSRPTKVVEYMARGVPVVTTPVPPAAALVEAAGCGLVVPFEDPPAAAAAVLRLRDDPGLRGRLALAGRAAALRDFDWAADGRAFVAALEAWAAGGGRGDRGTPPTP